MELARPDWDEYFMDLAKLVATRGTCDRARVGCVFVRGNRLITSGYNGSIAGDPHCDDVGHLLQDGHCIRTIHAEENAILGAAEFGISLKGTDCFVTHKPCFACYKRLAQVGVVRINYLLEHRVYSYVDTRGLLRRWAPK